MSPIDGLYAGAVAGCVAARQASPITVAVTRFPSTALGPLRAGQGHQRAGLQSADIGRPPTGTLMMFVSDREPREIRHIDVLGLCLARA